MQKSDVYYPHSHKLLKHEEFRDQSNPTAKKNHYHPIANSNNGSGNRDQSG